MKTRFFRIKSVNFLTSVAACGLVLLWQGCEDATHPTPPPPAYTLDIYPANGVPEVVINTNIAIGGRLQDGQGDLVAGKRVYFTIQPEDIGSITTWATTEPDSSDGFRERVIFNGRSLGVALIRGFITDVGGQEAAHDTLSIWVREQING